MPYYEDRHGRRFYAREGSGLASVYEDRGYRRVSWCAPLGDGITLEVTSQPHGGAHEATADVDAVIASETPPEARRQAHGGDDGEGVRDQ